MGSYEIIPRGKRFSGLFNRVHPEIWGFIAIGILLACVLLSSIGYVGTQGEPYSFLNHYISELGQVGVSHLAPLFNTGLILGGFIAAVFMLGLGLYLNTTLARVAMGFGIFSGIACSFIGFLPMNNPHHHVPAALSFFFGGMIAVVIFSIAIFRQKEAKIPRLLCIAGVVVAGIFAAFLVVAIAFHSGSLTYILGLAGGRPHIWWRTILEWSVFFAIIVWVLLISIFMFIKNKKLGKEGSQLQT